MKEKPIDNPTGMPTNNKPPEPFLKLTYVKFKPLREQKRCYFLKNFQFFFYQQISIPRPSSIRS